MVFLRSSDEGTTTTLFGRTFKTPGTPSLHQNPDNHSEPTMSQDDSDGKKPPKRADGPSAEQGPSDSRESAGTVVDAQPHRTGQPVFWPGKFKPVKGHRNEHEKANSKETGIDQSQHHRHDVGASSGAPRNHAQHLSLVVDSDDSKLKLHLRGGDLEEDCCAGLFGGLCLSFACLQVFCPDPQ